MLTWMKAKAVVLSLALIGAVIIAGTGVAFAASHHAGPFAIKGANAPGSHTGDSENHAQGKQATGTPGATCTADDDQNEGNTGEDKEGTPGPNVTKTPGSGDDNHGTPGPNVTRTPEPSDANHGTPGTDDNHGTPHPEATKTPDAARTPEPTEKPEATKTPEPSDCNEQPDVVGIITAIDTNASKITVQPQDKTKPTVTIAFDTHTSFEQDEGVAHDATSLKTGLLISVDVVKRQDGSLYAEEIKILANGGTPGDDHKGTPSPEKSPEPSKSPTPTPKPGD
jgi:hypothetical protein